MTSAYVCVLFYFVVTNLLRPSAYKSLFENIYINTFYTNQFSIVIKLL